MEETTATVAGSQPDSSVSVADPGASPAPDSAGAPSAPSESPNIKQLREQYEQTKQQLEPWAKLGAKPEEASKAFTTYKAMTDEAMKLGKSMGYEDAYLAGYLEKDLAGTLAQLRQYAREANSQPLTPEQIERRLSQKVDERLKSFEQKETERSNKEAEFRYTGERDRQIKAQFKDDEITDDLREFVEQQVDEYMGGDEGAMGRLREGQVADVAKYVQQAKTRFTKLLASVQQREKSRSPGAPAAKPADKPNPSDRQLKMVPGMSIKDLQAFRRG